jgi:acyl-CoA synthetase (AMP-forming)/AMP-acid ligase II
MGSDEIVWMPSPIGHSTGFNYGVRTALYHGLPIVLQDRWSAAEAADIVERYRCTHTVAATTFLADLVHWGAEHGGDLSSLRLFGSGGAPVPAALVEKAAGLGIDVLRIYGSTELLAVSWNRPSCPLEKRIATDGRAIDGVEIDVRDDGGSIRNAPGEILVRSAQTCVGFHGDPERTAAMFEPDGWARSGDLGVLDDDGYLTIVGRKKEILIRGGLNIAPREIEEMILELPGVAAAAVIGLPHERLSELTCACVVLRPQGSLTLETLVSMLKTAGLATFKLPQALALVEALPMTASGKVQKFALVDAVGRGELAVTMLEQGSS